MPPNPFIISVWVDPELLSPEINPTSSPSEALISILLLTNTSLKEADILSADKLLVPFIAIFSSLVELKFKVPLLFVILKRSSPRFMLFWAEFISI